MPVLVFRSRTVNFSTLELFRFGWDREFLQELFAGHQNQEKKYVSFRFAMTTLRGSTMYLLLCQLFATRSGLILFTFQISI